MKTSAFLQPSLQNLFLLFFSCFVVVPVSAECLLRLAIHAGVDAVRRPELYADMMSDDDYWILTNRWRLSPSSPGKGVVHAELGWTQVPPDAGNPLGLFSSTLRRLNRDSRPKILFYGDSFVQGGTSRGQSLPELMQKQLQGSSDVLHLGVGGYGTDQIFLLFSKTHEAVDNAAVILGIYLEDMDRAALTYREGQKPYFDFDAEGRLELKGLPIEADQEKYLESRKLKFRSYFLRFLAKKAGFYRPDFEWSAHKVRLNKAFAKEIHRLCRERNLPLAVVFFYHSASFSAGPPAANYLEDYFKELQVPVINTGELIWSDLKRRGGRIEDYYGKDKGHHNLFGNQILSEGILQRLLELEMIPGSVTR